MHKIPIDRIPAKGFILAYFSHHILFDTYEVQGNSVVCEALESCADEEMTECHLFDRDAEYRAVFSQSRNEWIATTLCRQEEDLMDRDLVYAQTVLVKDKYTRNGNLPKQLTVINRYKYSANDTLVQKDYRISCA